MGLTFQIKNLDKITEEIKNAPKEMDRIINNELEAFGKNMVNTAKYLAPVNEGTLKNSITSELTADKQLTVGTKLEYAPYVEFGTKSFAQYQVATLPPDWQTFAAEFKGQGGGSFQQMVMYLTMWVHQKGLGSGYQAPIGITGTYSIKTRKRTGNKTLQNMQDKQAAYLIARKILRVGIHATPFFYPAFELSLPEFLKYLKQNLQSK